MVMMMMMCVYYYMYVCAHVCVCTVCLISYLCVCVRTYYMCVCTRARVCVCMHVCVQGSPAELIYYNRPDHAGPKLSEFHKTEVSDPENLKVIGFSVCFLFVT